MSSVKPKIIVLDDDPTGSQTSRIVVENYNLGFNRRHTDLVVNITFPRYPYLLRNR